MAEAVLVVAIVGLQVVFVFVFLVDGGMKMWAWVVMRLWVWICDFGGWGLWWLSAGGFFCFFCFFLWWWLAMASRGCSCDWGCLN